MNTFIVIIVIPIRQRTIRGGITSKNSMTRLSFDGLTTVCTKFAGCRVIFTELDVSTSGFKLGSRKHKFR